MRLGSLILGHGLDLLLPVPHAEVAVLGLERRAGDQDLAACAQINQCVGWGTVARSENRTATPSSSRRVDGVQVVIEKRREI